MLIVLRTVLLIVLITVLLIVLPHLTAFKLWLQHGSRDKKPPEQLPIVLQVLMLWWCCGCCR